jgi:hypothetical protein
MIGYCPIEEEPPVRLPPRVRSPVQRPGPDMKREDTETNYVVLFFIAGVLALAAMDSVKK